MTAAGESAISRATSGLSSSSRVTEGFDFQKVSNDSVPKICLCDWPREIPIFAANLISAKIQIFPSVGPWIEFSNLSKSWSHTFEDINFNSTLFREFFKKALLLAENCRSKTFSSWSWYRQLIAVLWHLLKRDCYFIISVLDQRILLFLRRNPPKNARIIS